MSKKKWLMIVPTVVVMVAVLFIGYKVFFENRVKTSVVTGVYDESYRDGCDGFKLENGDRVNTFCFWTPPDQQTKSSDSIKIGDTVEYWVEGNRQFIRLKTR